jgi:hypothetical protein
MTRSYRALGLALIATLALAASSTDATAKGKSAVGTLMKVDGQTLTIQTTKGSETVMVAPAAKIRSHAKSLSSADLSSHVGDRVKVVYTESNGQKQASAVTVSSATSTKKASASANHAGKKATKS